MSDRPHAVLQKMLERLFASLVSGPAMNCRPHSSRQRIDLAQLGRLGDISGEEVLRRLLGPEREARLTGRATKPKRELKKNKASGDGGAESDMTDEEKRTARLWADQQTIVGKLRTMAEDARTYEQDTGVHVLHVGFPLLSMPPGGATSRGFLARRIVAPIAFIPVALELKTGAAISVHIASKGEGVDLVRPNIALLAWIEQQTGRRTPELFDDHEAEDPWREIRELVAHTASALKLPAPAIFAESGGLSETFSLAPAPRADDEGQSAEILPSSVIGLYPMANEGLLRDMQTMCGQSDSLAGPVKSFLHVDISLGAPPEEKNADPAAKQPRSFADERLVTHADPCQSRAALLARKAAGLVIHGPPGTGKSQTITNIIGDHLARGQRVLMVCDKRTALDVVANRLTHLGFGPLLALVHDPQRDQRDLYRAIRERLENLADVRTSSTAQRDLERTDAELQQLHNDLSAYWKCLMTADASGLSFHAVMGEWLAIQADSSLELDPQQLQDVPLDAGRAHARHVQEIFERAGSAQFAQNPWASAAAISLADFLARPMEEFRHKLMTALDAAKEARSDIDPEIPAIAIDQIEKEAPARRQLADLLERAAGHRQDRLLMHWSGRDANAFARAQNRFRELKPAVDLIYAKPLDGMLLAGVQSQLPSIAAINTRLGQLAGYRSVARKWYAFAAFGAKGKARKVVEEFGLALSADSADQVAAFLEGLRARLLVRDALAEMIGDTPSSLPHDDDMKSAIGAHSGAVLAIMDAKGAPDPVSMEALVRKLLAEPQRIAHAVENLRRSAARCDAIIKTDAALGATGLCSGHALRDAMLRHKAEPQHFVEALLQFLPQLEDVLRIQESASHLPKPLAEAVYSLIARGAGGEDGPPALTRALLGAEISRRLRTESWLQTMDGQRLKTTFERYRQLDEKKRALVRQVVLHQWVSRQKERLLASTQSRVSSLGADLRRRLTMRGERALRLRQVIEIGKGIEGGDPLFDMAPVWMASPETVAQIFPREAIFDVVIFDEASQCRLEEALPVLTRAHRVVVAGDPKQLPPTRFFESTIVASDDDAVDGEQSLFERQQGEVEDLLTAALNLSIENAYLDVHYRSRNSDLIGFSNDQFYHHRLQAIPGHPKNTAAFSPLTLYRADGIYEERANEKEAEQVCRIVHDLLRRAQPPSIGIACFNIVQRDLIVEKLDAVAAQDDDFAQRLAAARKRQGPGSFEGLFVKNLENVQGDERDHIIISTTYGPQKDGRFYQRFGPLGRAGGGRRLNVLVTRARQEVHLVTSIPEEIYRSLPPVPAGETPGGAWLLYAYLQFAERLAAAYDRLRSGTAPDPSDLPAPIINVQQQIRSLPSRFSESLAQRLAEKHATGSTVHWGNDGFCIDVALAHPARPDDVTIGVLCDGTRFQNADDPVEWDLFRTAIHESQGWNLHRIWTPQFFRQPAEFLDAIAQKAREHLATEKPPDALGVVKTDA